MTKFRIASTQILPFALLTVTVLLFALQAVQQIKVNQNMLNGADAWLAASVDVLPPCDVQSPSDGAKRVVEDVETGSEGNLLAAGGRALWLNGQCDQAIKMWLAALDDGFVPAAIYLVNSDHWSEVPAQSRNSASQYAEMLAAGKSQAGNMDEAIKWYTRSYELTPRPSTAQWLADYHFFHGHVSDASRVWTVMSARLPYDDPNHWLAVGKSAALREDWTAAADAYSKAARITTEPAEFILLEADAFERASRSSDAEAAYQRVVEVAPKNMPAYAAVVDLALLRNDTERARSWQEMAHSIAATDEAAQALGYAYLMRGRPSLARPYLERGYKRAGSDFWSAYLWAQILHHDERLEEAIGTLEQAITLHPGQPWQWQLQLGDWYLEASNSTAAREAYQVATEWGADAESLQTRLDEMP